MKVTVGENVKILAGEEPVSEDASLTEPKLIDKYQVLSVIGSGGTSVVYKAVDPGTGKFFAVKVLKTSSISDPQARQRFLIEAQVVQQLDHTNIIKVQESAVMDDGTPYLVMEWLDGETLADRLKREGTVPVKQAAELLSQIAKALDYAHEKGIVHRDVKPSNILLVQSDTGLQVKIMDFGIAKILGDNSQESIHTQPGTVMGSPAYMSPEQCLGEDIDARSDIYSFGCVMYETLIGKNPFVAATPLGTILKHLETDPQLLITDDFHRLKVPEFIERSIIKCLAKDPELRFHTANELLGSLTAPPNFVARAVSFTIDAAFIVAITMVITIAGSMASQWTAPEFREFFILQDWYEYGLMILVQLVCLFYVAIFESSPLAATPGKLLAGLRVVKPDGGRYSVIDSIARLTTLFSAIWILRSLFSSSDVTWAIDAATGSCFAQLGIVGWLVLLLLFFYIPYLVFFVYLKGETWHFDALFNRRVLPASAVRTMVPQRRKESGRKRWALAVAALSLGSALGLAQLEQSLFHRAWGDTSIPKDAAAYARVDIEPGTAIESGLVGLKPSLRHQKEKHLHSLDQVQDRIARYRISSGSSVDASDVEPSDEIEDSITLTLEAQSKVRDGNRDEALTDYVKAVKLNPNEKEAWKGLADIYRHDGQAAQMKRAEKMAAGCSVPGAAEIARQLNEAADPRRALAAVDYALAANPDDIECLRQKALALYHMEAYVNQERVLRKLIQKKPADSDALGNLAELLFSQSSALSVHDNDPPSKSQWQARIDEAREMAIRSVKADPNNAQSWETLAKIENQMGKFSEAESAFRKVLALNKDVSFETLNSYVDVLVAQGKDKEAEPIRKRAEKFFKQTPEDESN